MSFEAFDVAAAEAGRIIQAYYEAPTGKYYLKNGRGVWLALAEKQLSQELRNFGYSIKRSEGEPLSKVENFLCTTRNQFDIAYAGPLAGYREGFYDENGSRFLVTEGPKLITPAPGDWPILRQFLENLLHDPDYRQLDHFYGWIKVAVEALQSNTRRCGQCLGLCGPSDCGKSVLQNLITSILGGRAGKPYQYMAGLTQFNADLFTGEHLMLEDEQASTDIRTRRNFGSKIKEFTVNETQRLHAKGRTPVMVRPFFRLSVSLNDEAENLMVLPPIDESLRDKLILLQATKKPMPMPTVTNEQRKAFWGTLIRELPAFLHWLALWQIPEQLVSPRFGIKEFQHPRILEELNELSPEARLLSLIDTSLFSMMPDIIPFRPWIGNAEQLTADLSGDTSPCKLEARRLLSFNNACGIYLGRLAKKYPHRFVPNRTSIHRGWTINPPAAEVAGK